MLHYSLDSVKARASIFNHLDGLAAHSSAGQFWQSACTLADGYKTANDKCRAITELDTTKCEFVFGNKFRGPILQFICFRFFHQRSFQCPKQSPGS